MLKQAFKTPPMGWNSYDYYDTTVNEEQIMANADFMAAHMKETGWEYIVVDIQWYASDAGTRRNEHQYIPFNRLNMDAYSRLIPCEKRFPSAIGGQGFKPLADYVHGLGLKFGIHIMRGVPRQAAHANSALFGTDLTANEIADPSSISKWNPDMYGVKATVEGQAYYDSIIELYARWGVDFIKCDDICNTNMYVDNPYSARAEIEMLSKAMDKVEREMVLSLSPGPALIEEAWHYEKYAHMWRITDDFWDNWDLLKNMFERTRLWERQVSEGNYPDCDMLPLGMLGKGFGHERASLFTREEQKTMMTLWSFFRSPMMVGAELTMLDDWTLNVLTNKQLLGFLEEGWTGRLLEMDDTHAIWTTVHKDSGKKALALFNLSEEDIATDLDMTWLTADLADKQVIDLWAEQTIKIEGNPLKVTLHKHDVALFYI